MWCIRMQSKKNTSGVMVSGEIHTQSGAEELLALYKKQASEAPDYAENPKHYFVAVLVKRGTKK